MEFSTQEIKNLVGLGALGILSAMLMGKTLRRIFVFLITPIIRWSSNKVDDQLLTDIESDLGLEHSNVLDLVEKEKEKK